MRMRVIGSFGLLLVACGSDPARPTPDAPGVPTADATGYDGASPDSSGPPDSPSDAPTDTPAIDATIDAPVDAGIAVDTAPPPDSAPTGVPACPTEEAPPCVVTLLSMSQTAVTVGWRICCPVGAEAISIAQAGAGHSFGEWDSLVTTCGQAYSMELGMDATAGPAWASIDTIEWPYTMESPITHCATPDEP